MIGTMVVHTSVIDVIDGAIRSACLTVEKNQNEILSVRIGINEDSTEITVDSLNIYSNDPGDIIHAINMIKEEVKKHGVELVRLR